MTRGVTTNDEAIKSQQLIASYKLIDKARGAIEAAEILLKAGKNNFAAGRAYYEMSYLAKSLLYGNL